MSKHEWEGSRHGYDYSSRMEGEKKGDDYSPGWRGDRTGDGYRHVPMSYRLTRLILPSWGSRSGY